MTDESTVIAKDYSGLGMVGTIIYVVIVLIVMVLTRDKFFALEPNAWGDFLAGAFGPLALGWLVISTFQQRVELKQNTSALLLQAKELEKSVEQQKELVSDNKRIIEFEISRYYDEKQPIINLRASNATINSATCSVQIDILISNHGYPATNIRLQCINAIGNPTFATFNSLLNFEPIGAKLDVPKNKFPIIVSIFYHDGLSNEKENYHEINVTLNDELGLVELLTTSSIQSSTYSP